MPDLATDLALTKFGLFIIIAFAAMLTLTLAFKRKPFFSDTKITDWLGAAFTLALAAFTWALVNVVSRQTEILSHTDMPAQDLRLYLRFPTPEQVGTDTLNVNYLFTNMGNQAVLIEDVGIYELWVNMNMKHSWSSVEKLPLCKADDDIFDGPEYWNSLLNSVPALKGKRQMKFADGVMLGDINPGAGGMTISLYQPVDTYVDGAEEKTSSATLEAGKMRVIATRFKTDPVPRDNYNTVVICPVIRYFDSRGHPQLAVCEGWQYTTLPGGGRSEAWALGGSPAILLPIASGGSCRSEGKRT
jgi:hypothetical protein